MAHVVHDETIANAPQAEGGAAGLFSLDRVQAFSSYIALSAAWVATSGSLFMSEVLRWTPCVMCWYQRILMYPLAILIAIGILRRDQALYIYVLPFSVFGAGVALYHYLLTKTTFLPPPPCVAGIPCTEDYLNWFGFINVPFLSLTAFLIISMAMVVTALRPKQAAGAETIEEEADTDEAPAAPAFSLADLAVFVIIGGVVLTFVVAGRLF